MTIEELYEWAIEKGLEHCDVVVSTFYGTSSFNPNADFKFEQGCLMIEYEC